MASAPRSDHLVWERTDVDGRRAFYGVAGEGRPLLFLHGWGLGQHAYKRPLNRLVRLGFRVYAPALPGFGGTPDLPSDRFSLEGYAAWAAGFLDAVGVAEPALVLGHSFGGGVAIQLAHDFSEHVSSLILINSIGGSTWRTAGSKLRSMAERPIWDWGIHFPSDLLPFPQVTRVLPVVLEDALPNMVRRPRTMWRVGTLARQADLTEELEHLKMRGLPVVVLWGDQDGIVTKDSFTAMCEALGSEGEVVSGNHSWLLADPDAFGEVITNVLQVAEKARSMERHPAARRRGLLGISRSRPRELSSVVRAKPGDEDPQPEGPLAAG